MNKIHIAGISILVIVFLTSYTYMTTNMYQTINKASQTTAINYTQNSPKQENKEMISNIKSDENLVINNNIKNVSAISKEKCGNSVIEVSEECDNKNLNGKNCVSFGFMSGILWCDLNCHFDTSDCISSGCGDGICDVNALECKTCPNDCSYTLSSNGNWLPYYQYFESTKTCRPQLTILTYKLFYNPNDPSIENYVNDILNINRSANIWEYFDYAQHKIVDDIKHERAVNYKQLPSEVLQTRRGMCDDRGLLMTDVFINLIQKLKPFGSAVKVEVKDIQFPLKEEYQVNNTGGHHAVVVEYNNVQAIYDTSSYFHKTGYTREQQVAIWTEFLNKYSLENKVALMGSSDFLVYNKTPGSTYVTPDIWVNHPLDIT